ncbi:MAG: sodium:proton antiporter [Sumerlaeia bacterium]
MDLLISLLAGFLASVALYLIMRRSVFEVVLGLSMLGNASFLALVTISGWEVQTHPPILVETVRQQEAAGAIEEAFDDGDSKGEHKEFAPPEYYVDPLPQALILTAIVISFGVTSFAIVLAARGYEENATLEVGELEAMVKTPPRVTMEESSPMVVLPEEECPDDSEEDLGREGARELKRAEACPPAARDAEGEARSDGGEEPRG